MNPETGEFKPDDGTLPDDWPRFEIGEPVLVKGHQFCIKAIDIQKHEVLVDGTPVQFRPAEFRLLQSLASQPGRVLTREQLLETAAGEDADVMLHNVSVRIAEVRRKLDRLIGVELPALEKKLNAAGVPWTPGRGIP